MNSNIQKQTATMTNKKTKISYWISTGIISLMMAFSAIAYFTSPEMAATFKQLGFPDYFRIELGVAKVIGLLILLIPAIPARLKEWAYCGFTIVFVSAFIAHVASGEGIGKSMFPLVILAILFISYYCFHKLMKSVN